jgi:hypothetical protein
MPVMDERKFISIDGPHGTFWISTEGIDPGRDDIFGYKDATQNFFFSVQTIIDYKQKHLSYKTTYADRVCPYLGVPVDLGKDKQNVIDNIEFFLKLVIIFLPKKS